ncbi:GNAT family N-acetyltransferase [Chondromyces apiculatus]|uniref:Acetyltransferase, gnat family n=1 Tax=Chondromyces apiculatus DSM 436 TaxID=1192034 RepID=A0A017TB84_9BACT|nr:GNAT family N-acetyltransferase [Chondromyces apiculatus]EYF06060.1 acetyltransferase, gnat family [Chondromyces apiculatus DSM 436]
MDQGQRQHSPDELTIDLMTRMPPLETERLLLREFTLEDLDDIHRVLDIELADATVGAGEVVPRDARAQWLTWTVLGYAQSAWLCQPPYGDRAVVLRETGEIVGAVGFVPCLAPFGQLPALRLSAAAPSPPRFTPELGLYYAISPRHQRRGYALEAACAMRDHAFRALRVARLVATTHHDNAGSKAVMRGLGMQIEENPLPEPPWLQVVGVLDAPGT